MFNQEPILLIVKPSFLPHSPLRHSGRHSLHYDPHCCGLSGYRLAPERAGPVALLRPRRDGVESSLLRWQLLAQA
eukprot:3170105-Pyramimonas_sp.AAC.1